MIRSIVESVSGYPGLLGFCAISGILFPLPEDFPYESDCQDTLQLEDVLEEPQTVETVRVTKQHLKTLFCIPTHAFGQQEEQVEERKPALQKLIEFAHRNDFHR